MFLALAVALALPAAPAFAADAPAAAEPAPICKTTTVVVRQGDVVLSTDTKTKCAKAGDSGGLDLNIDGGAVGGALGGLFSAPAFDVGAAGGDWKTVQQGSHRVCKLRLLRKPGPKGRGVRTDGCIGALASAKTWTLENDAAVLHSDSGARIVRLTGDNVQLEGRLDDGIDVVLKR
jgi:hypothetical protein